MIPRDSIETAYCFFHQKWRVYEHSTLDWQRDDIEVAIADYVDGMNPLLYKKISGGNAEFLRVHRCFASDMSLAVERLERLLTEA